MADNNTPLLSDSVVFVNGRNGQTCAAKIVKLNADGTSNLVYWGPLDGLHQFVSDVPYSVTLKANTFHFPDEGQPASSDAATANLARVESISASSNAPVNEVNS